LYMFVKQIRYLIFNFVYTLSGNDTSVMAWQGRLLLQCDA
jgi:hypothetical protein